MTEQDDITALMEGFCAPWNAGDVSGVTALYTDDARLISPFGHDARGRDAIQRLYQSFIADGPLHGSQTTMDLEDVRMLGDDCAIADARQVIDGGDLGALDLHLTCVVTRTDHGWRVAEARPYAYLPLPVAAG